MGANRSVRWRVGAAIVVIAVGACGPAVPSGTPGSAATQTPTPTAAATTPPSTAAPTAAPDQANAMRLVGSVAQPSGDLAFWGDLAVVTRMTDWDRETEDDGLMVVDIADPTAPKVLGQLRCMGAFQDVSVWDGIAVLSQDRVLPANSCALESGPNSDAAPFAGLRIVSIADPASPLLVASVRTAVDAADATQVRGSHNNTIVPDLAHDRLLVYASVFYHPETHPHAAIVEIPMKEPAAARVIGSFENGTDRPCHDITVFVPRRIAACAAYEAGVILFDITDPAAPTVITHFEVPEIVQNGESHHSTVFSNDGTSLVVNAELGGETCIAGSGSSARSLSFYDVSNPSNPEHRGSFQLPRKVSGRDCYPHQSNIVPTTDRDMVVTGWTGAGVSIVDFTDPSAPREVAYWTSGELNGMHTWANYAYWYNGRVYGTGRGLDIFEVDAGLVSGARTLPNSNPQTQEAPPG